MLSGLAVLPSQSPQVWGIVGGYLGFSVASLAFSIVALARPPLASGNPRGGVRVMFTGNGVIGSF